MLERRDGLYRRCQKVTLGRVNNAWNCRSKDGGKKERLAFNKDLNANRFF